MFLIVTRLQQFQSQLIGITLFEFKFYIFRQVLHIERVLTILVMIDYKQSRCKCVTQRATWNRHLITILENQVKLNSLCDKLDVGRQLLSRVVSTTQQLSLLFDQPSPHQWTSEQFRVSRCSISVGGALEIKKVVFN